MTAALPKALIEHQVTGRMRLRIPARRKDVGFFDDTAKKLLLFDRITRVAANPVTAGILILHDGDGSGVLAEARDAGLFDTAAPPVDPLRKQKPSMQALETQNPRDAAAIALAAAGLMQVARGRVLGSASENLWNAYGVYVTTRQTRVTALLAGFGLLQLMRGEALGSAVSLFLYAWGARRLARGKRAEDTI